VLIGLGPQVNERQMEELDDLDTGTEVDLWDHKLAAEMRVLQEIFAEVVDKNARVADNGRILDPQGRVAKDFSGVGLPAFLDFEVPAGSESFTLEVNGQRIHQPLSDKAKVPVRDEVVHLPVTEQKPAPKAVSSAALAAEEDNADAEWKHIHLELRSEEETPTELDLGDREDGLPTKP
jgi:hypothetical protein